MEKLGDRIKKTPKKGVVELSPSIEYHEQLVIKKPITIRAEFSSPTIVENAPTIVIASKNVTLENINVVCRDRDGVCLRTQEKFKPVFKNVTVKGKVEGLDGEDGNWEIPDTLPIKIVPNRPNRKKIVVSCPTSADLTVENITDLDVDPKVLHPGINEVFLEIDDIMPNTIINGNLVVVTSRYKLKRSIGISGNTFDKNYDKGDETVYVCQEADIRINKDILDNLPDGMEGEPYEFKIDLEAIADGDCDVFVEGLPKSLALDKTLPLEENKMPFVPPALDEINIPARKTEQKKKPEPVRRLEESVEPFPTIKGVPEESGIFDIKFKFCKRDIEKRYTTRMRIEKRVVIPLKTRREKGPIRILERKTINKRIEVLSANSSNVVFKPLGDLPEGLQLNDLTGELRGKFEKHGHYTATIEISDGVNATEHEIRFQVLPEKELKPIVHMPEKLYKGEYFEIPITVEGSEGLDIEISLAKNPIGARVQKIEDGYCLAGRIEDTDPHEVDIFIKDVYGRNAVENLVVKCLEKPTYTVDWTSRSYFEKRGPRGREFQEKIATMVNEAQDLKVAFSCPHDMPPGYSVEKDGTIKGVIDGKEHEIRIVAAFEGGKSEKSFKFRTNVDSIKDIDKPASSIFTWCKPEEKVELVLKTNLRNGRVGEKYYERILSKGGSPPECVSVKVKGLPKGLRFDSNRFVVEGEPEREGDYVFDVDDGRQCKRLTLKVMKNLTSPHEASEPSRRTPKKPKQMDILGKAFKNWK